MKQKLLIAALFTLALPTQAAEPLELQKVMKELGKNMQVITDGISREDWKLVADTAHDLLLAAHEQDGQKVIAAFGKVQSSCLNCHQTFRGKFVEHFYGASAK